MGEGKVGCLAVGWVAHDIGRREKGTDCLCARGWKHTYFLRETAVLKEQRGPAGTIFKVRALVKKAGRPVGGVRTPR